MMDLEQIKKEAEAEIRQEEHRKAVDKMKEKLRAKKWYHSIFPWKIVVIKRD